jgi:hypothetical protein
MDAPATLLDDARRLLAVIEAGQSAASFPAAMLEQMRRLMRRDLRAGLRLACDEPAGLLALHRRALPSFLPPACQEAA